MKNNSPLSAKFKYILILSLFLTSNIIISQDSKTLLTEALTNSSLQERGVIKPDENDFRLDYDDVYEKDTHAKFLQEKGFHGGGPSWLGILYGAFKICGNDLIENTDSDASVTGISFWSSKKEDLQKISRIIFVLKSNEAILLEAIEIAKQNEMML